ncbi:hypothetical protein PUN28_005933 [Cardiocondyla obscurior]|uniref:Uncharacterized protein n=1 Tax=Cardiocondyla obscurior TaxID=286306 RepID=A0AAW2GA14_9HYME
MVRLKYVAGTRDALRAPPKVNPALCMLAREQPVVSLPERNYTRGLDSSGARTSYSEFGNHVQRCDRHLLREHYAILQ